MSLQIGEHKMIPNEKKRLWLEKTGNPTALSLLEAGIAKNAEVATVSNLLYKNEEKMNENEPVVEETPNAETETPVTEAVVDEVVAEQPADANVLAVLEPLVKAIEVLNTRIDALEKSATVQKSVTASLLPSAAKTSAILKDRLSFLSAETFMTEATTDLAKQKPAEGSVKVATEAETLFNGFLNGN